MAEYSNYTAQTVQPGAPVVFTETPAGCSRGFIMHREGSGVVTLRAGNNRARYKVTFGGNLAIPAGGTAGPVSIAIALEGEGLPASAATVTPAAAGEYFNVAVFAFIDVPCGCCLPVSVRNVGAVAVDVANPNLIVERVA